MYRLWEFFLRNCLFGCKYRRSIFCRFFRSLLRGLFRAGTAGTAGRAGHAAGAPVDQLTRASRSTDNGTDPSFRAREWKSRSENSSPRALA